VPEIRRFLPRGAVRLRCTTGTSNKFYDILLHAADEAEPRRAWCYTSHYGRVGTTGCFQTKQFSTRSEAEHAFRKQVNAKLNKGYLYTTQSGADRHGVRLDQVSQPQGQPDQTPEPPAATGRRRSVIRD
jgi:predicted DNA-binding WGR domain protein